MSAPTRAADRGHARLVVALLVMLLPLGAVRAARGATGPDAGERLLEEARRAATDHEFAGVVVVEWVEGGRWHRERVAVSGESGILEVGRERRLLGRDEHRLVEGPDGWLLLWSDRPSAPSPAAKYELRVGPGPLVAGRATRLVEAVLAGEVRERSYVDAESGLLLRREVLDADGRVVRVVGFVSVSGLRPATGGSSEPWPDDVEPSAPEPVEELDDPFRAPETAGDGYGLVARHRHADGTLQLFYSDGVFGISVFEQRGRLDARRLPAGGRVDEVAGDEAHRYPVPGGEVLVWEGDELVFTCVGDAPIEDLRTFAEDLAREPEPGILTSLARAVLAPFRWG